MASGYHLDLFIHQTGGVSRFRGLIIMLRGLGETCKAVLIISWRLLGSGRKNTKQTTN